MADYAIKGADLREIENTLNALHHGITELDTGIKTINSNVHVVNDEVGKLAKDFYSFVQQQEMSNRFQLAETRLVKIRQDLDTQYGHYSIIRRTTSGILQADDLGIVRKDTISTATEELMISTPNYWLAPCLVALAAWIKDQPELAEKALNEGIKRDDEKTSLLFALICRRAGRKQASLKWTQRYLANQDEENLDRKAIIILDAFASGLLGADSEGVVSSQMAEWLDRLASKPGFVEKQIVQWSAAINAKREPFNDELYPFLSKYSHTWPDLKYIMEGAILHDRIFNYFDTIFNQESSSETLKVQLDGVLDSLVSDFDDEEIPLRKEEKLEQFVVDFKGDEMRAQSNMQVEQSAFETHKEFTQLLTDAAMKPESSHASPSTQKFAIALSKDWISEAYADTIASNRMKVPHEISINIDTFNDSTTDGQNEGELVSNFNNLIDQEKENTLSQVELTLFEKYSLIGGGAAGVLGFFQMIGGSKFMGLLAIIGGVALIFHHYSRKRIVDLNRQAISDQFEEKRNTGTNILLATLAEVVDFRNEFAKRDKDSEKVENFLEQITPDQYVKTLANSSRRIVVNK